jgi:hypothetical protein
MPRLSSRWKWKAMPFIFALSARKRLKVLIGECRTKKDERQMNRSLNAAFVLTFKFDSGRTP